MLLIKNELCEGELTNVLASVSYNFSFGRKFKTGQRRVNNSDNDSGVMSNRKINKIII